jgi:hypothetical protein
MTTRNQFHDLYNKQLLILGKIVNAELLDSALLPTDALKRLCEIAQQIPSLESENLELSEISSALTQLTIETCKLLLLCRVSDLTRNTSETITLQALFIQTLLLEMLSKLSCLPPYLYPPQIFESNDSLILLQTLLATFFLRGDLSDAATEVSQQDSPRQI